MMAKLKDFYMTGDDFLVTDEVTHYFQQHGFILVRGLLDTEEISLLRTAFEQDSSREKYSFKRDDGLGLKNKYYVWFKPGDDITGMVARSEKVAGTLGQLLGGDLYHYHSKLIQKDPKTGGAFSWHQDYGYWYHSGYLFPHMGTVYIGLDKATTSNGCLTVIPGSHRMGRLDHVPFGEEIITEPGRLKHAIDTLGTLPCELEPGDAIFFHCNVLHSSGQNHSERRRWALNIAYNRCNNIPIKPQYCDNETTLHRVPNSSIRHAGVSLNGEGKEFMVDTKTELKELTKLQKE